MSDTKGVLIVGGDALLTGTIKNARRVEVHGKVDGGIFADDVIVHTDGNVKGQVHANAADVRGRLEGDVRVQNLIAIKSTGSVSGNVKYGRLAMEEGAELAAHVRNVPPSIAGDLDLSVKRGRSVRITRADLSATDPDDTADKLTFTVSNLNGGYITTSAAPKNPILTFTQSALEAGEVSFVHDGGSDARARFDVVVADDDGATSGAPKTVNVAVI